jgi:hypothetical protein
MDAQKGIVWADRGGDHHRFWLDILLLQWRGALKIGLG